MCAISNAINVFLSFFLLLIPFRLESYSCKLVASEKKLFKSMNAADGLSPNDLEALSPPNSSSFPGNSFSSSFTSRYRFCTFVAFSIIYHNRHCQLVAPLLMMDVCPELASEPQWAELGVFWSLLLRLLLVPVQSLSLRINYPSSTNHHSLAIIWSSFN